MNNLPRQHFVKQYAERPPVDSLVVALVHDYLRCEVLGSSAERVTPVDNFLGKPKISDAHVPIGADEQIFWFEVAVCNLSLVQKLQR